MCLVSFAAPAVLSAPIVQDQQNGAVQILHASPIGQTFTAEDAVVSIGFFIRDFNNVSQSLNDDDLSISLYDGSGGGGSPLASVSITGLAVGFAGWVDAVFSSIILAAGQTYTAMLSDDTPAWGVDLSGENPYAGGSMITYGGIRQNLDSRFRVLPQQSVPEPATLLLISTALLGAVVTRRRKSALS